MPARLLRFILPVVVAVGAQSVLAAAPPPGLKAKKAADRIAAVFSLTDAADPDATQQLIGALKDRSAAVRKSAATALGSHSNADADAALKTAARDDKSAAVREAAKRARAAIHERAVLKKTVIVVEVPGASALSKSVPEPALKQLTEAVRAAVGADPRRAFSVREATTKEKGYGLMLAIRDIKPSSQGNVSLLEVKCELTLLSLPGRSLRLASSASAAAGVEGKIDDAMRTELIGDAVRACAPALAGDFLQYALSRPPP